MNLISVKEAALKMKVSPTTVRRYLKAGKLQGVQYGRDIKIIEQSLEELIKQSKIGGFDNE